MVEVAVLPIAGLPGKVLATDLAVNVVLGIPVDELEVVVQSPWGNERLGADVTREHWLFLVRQVLVEGMVVEGGRGVRLVAALVALELLV